MLTHGVTSGSDHMSSKIFQAVWKSLDVTYAALDLTSGNITSRSKVKSIIAVYRLRMKSIVSSGTSGDIVLQTGNYIMGWNLLTQVIGVQYNQGEGVGSRPLQAELPYWSANVGLYAQTISRRCVGVTDCMRRRVPWEANSCSVSQKNSRIVLPCFQENIPSQINLLSQNSAIFI